MKSSQSNPMDCADAMELLLLRRRIAANAGLSDLLRAQLLKSIDQVRRKHEDQSPNCECWLKVCAELARGAAA